MHSAVFKPFPKHGPSLCRHSCRGTCCAAAAAAGGRQADAGRAVWSHACAPVSAHSCQHASRRTCTLRHGQTCFRRQQWVSAPHIPLILSQRSMVLRNWVGSGACQYLPSCPTDGESCSCAIGSLTQIAPQQSPCWRCMYLQESVLLKRQHVPLKLRVWLEQGGKVTQLCRKQA